MVIPLKVGPVSDAQPIRVQLRNYSHEQGAFLAEMVSQLVHPVMAYISPTSPLACAPRLVSKHCPAKFRLTVDLGLLNRFTVRHQFPMPQN